MSTEELAMEHGNATPREKRVVEAEIKMPRLEDLKMPKIDIEPVRSAAEQVLLTGIGVGVLAARGLRAAVRAAYAAGQDAARDPGPLTKALLDLVKPSTEGAEEGPIRRQVPVLPIDNYDTLSVDEITVRLPDLTDEQLRVVRAYEENHQARPEVLAAIDRRLGTV
ncbi:MAG TPA: hypothetical protein GX714_04550 [Chloroflexi bacterium]|jgi:hypothetical protein|nr:hypothetical protein [Chloroflexota bacterium]